MNTDNRAGIRAEYNPFKKFAFWQKFGRFLLLGLSLIILLAGSQQVQFSNVSAEEPCGVNTGECPTPPQEPPAEPPAVSCPDDLRYCDTNINKIVHKFGGVPDTSQPDGCRYAFVEEGACEAEAPPPAPAVSCPDDLRYCDTNINKIVHKFGGVPDASQPDGCRYAFVEEGACVAEAPPAPATVTVCTGAVLTCDQLHNALRQANFPGPFDCSQAEIDGFNRAACPAQQPAPQQPAPQQPAPQNQFCNASYSVSPANPQSNSAVTVNVSANSSNFQCIQILQDGQPLSCASDALGAYRCTSNSGSAGTHTLQAKFGQAAAYPGVNCGVPVDCNAATFSVAAPVPASPPPACVPNGTCSASAPACGTTTSGVDNCGNACNKVGPACPVASPPPAQIVCQPALQTVQINQFASLVSNNTGRAITWSAPNGNPSSGTGTNFSTRFAQTGTFNVTVSDGLTSSICRVTAQLAPAPTPSPIPTPIPTPPAGAPAPDQNITLQCPNGSTITVAAGQNVNMNTLCQSQQQTADADARADARTGPITVSFGNVGVAAQPAVVQPIAVQPAVVPQVAGVAVTTLPKTGLPLLAWSLLAFIPTGFGLRKFKQLKREREDDPSFIWEDRKFKTGV